MFFFLFQKFSDEGFINDYDHFKSRTFELDRKLGSVLGKAFDDCLVTEAIFKLLQIFGTLIQRNLIAQELSERMPTLVSMLNQEMDEIRIIYDKQMKRIGNNGKPLIDKVKLIFYVKMIGSSNQSEVSKSPKSLSHAFRRYLHLYFIQFDSFC